MMIVLLVVVLAAATFSILVHEVYAQSIEDQLRNAREQTDRIEKGLDTDTRLCLGACPTSHIQVRTALLNI
jgi:hypothetical protein